jgi:hypothetical protein
MSKQSKLVSKKSKAFHIYAANEGKPAPYSYYKDLTEPVFTTNRLYCCSNNVIAAWQQAYNAIESAVLNKKTVVICDMAPDRYITNDIYGLAKRLLGTRSFFINSTKGVDIHSQITQVTNAKGLVYWPLNIEAQRPVSKIKEVDGFLTRIQSSIERNRFNPNDVAIIFINIGHWNGPEQSKFCTLLQKFISFQFALSVFSTPYAKDLSRFLHTVGFSMMMLDVADSIKKMLNVPFEEGEHSGSYVTSWSYNDWVQVTLPVHVVASSSDNIPVNINI